MHFKGIKDFEVFVCYFTIPIIRLEKKRIHVFYYANSLFILLFNLSKNLSCTASRSRTAQPHSSQFLPASPEG